MTNSYKEGTSMTRPPLLDSSNYGYWKVRMQAFISNLDEDCWNSIELGWEPPKIKDEEGVEILKPRDKWTAEEKKLSSCNSKAKTAIYNAIDSSHFKLISQCASAQKAWKSLENMFEGTTSVKRTKLDMLASQFENLRMEEKETVAEFSAKLCDISNEAFALGKHYKDKKLVKKMKRSLPAKFESKISAVEEAHNLDEMAFDEFVGILKAFELSKAYEAEGIKKKEDETVKKEADIGVALKVSSSEDSMAMLSKEFAKYLKRKGKEKKNRIDEEVKSSSKSVQCYECKGYGHVRSECANLHKHKKKAMNVVTSDSETDSDEEEDLKNFVAFTHFSSETASDSETERETATTSATASEAAYAAKPATASATAAKPATASATAAEPATASESTTTTKPASATTPATTTEPEAESDSDAESIDYEELGIKYEMLYGHWLKVVEENSVLTKEKLKLEAKVVEIEKYATEKEEEASKAKVQLEETQKNLRMLNNGTKQLDHILNVGKTNRCGLGFKGNHSKSAPTFVYGGKITSASGTATEIASASGTTTETATVTETATATATKTVFVKERGAKTSELQSKPRRNFHPTCYHCGRVGHIRSRCFRMMRERNQMVKCYDLRFHGPTCYHCGVQGHIKRNCFRFIRESSHEGLRRKKIWVRKDDFYGDGTFGYRPRIAKRGEFSN